MDKTIKRLIQSKTFGLIVLAVAMYLILYIINPACIAKGNIRGVLNDLCVQGVMLAGLSCLIISGNIDLSSGALAALGSLVFAQLLAHFPALPWPVALVITLCFGAAAALVNIFFINVLNFMSFIVTIGMMSVFGGIATVWTRGNNVNVNVTSFTDLGKVALFDVIPLFFVVMIVIVLLHGIMLTRTRFGRSVYMVGGNPAAARLSGLNPKRVRAILFIDNSVMSVLAGIIWVAQKKLSSPTNITTAAPNMTAITASILGGISFMGGSGGIAGAFVGMLILSIVSNGLNVLRLPSYWSIFIQGLLLIIALIWDNVNMKRQQKALQASKA